MDNSFTTSLSEPERSVFFISLSGNKEWRGTRGIGLEDRLKNRVITKNMNLINICLKGFF